MAIVKCQNGHYYNNEESASCPYCSNPGNISATIPLGQGAPASVPAAGPDGGFGKTEPLQSVNNQQGVVPETKPVNGADYGSTVFKDDSKNSEVNPVRGWLVVCEGKKLGFDYRIRTGMNSIGRKQGNDIVFDFDNTISGIKACYVIYDERNNIFYLMAGESKNLIYINGKPLLRDCELFDNDIIEIGNTKLVFRSLCNSTFNYKMDGEDSAK